MFNKGSGKLKRGNYWTVSTRVVMYSILSPSRFVNAILKTGRTFASRDNKGHQIHHWTGSYCRCRNIFRSLQKVTIRSKV